MISNGTLLTQDPIGLAGGVNLYEYAGSNPVSFDDPFGLCPPYDENDGPHCNSWIRGSNVERTISSGIRGAQGVGRRAEALYNWLNVLTYLVTGKKLPTIPKPPKPPVEQPQPPGPSGPGPNPDPNKVIIRTPDGKEIPVDIGGPAPNPQRQPQPAPSPAPEPTPAPAPGPAPSPAPAPPGG